MSGRVNLASLPVQDPRRHVPMKELPGVRMRLKDIGRWRSLDHWRLRELTFHAICDLDDLFDVECDDTTQPGRPRLRARATCGGRRTPTKPRRTGPRGR